MSIWKWFGSERRVLEALDQSVGYDISPSVIHFPANTNEPPQEEPVSGKKPLTLWNDYEFQKNEMSDDEDVWGSVKKRG